MQKGQIAIETLMVYGFAILAVAVAIGALYYAGLAPEKIKPRICTLEQGLACTDFKVQETGIEILIKNLKGSALQINSIGAEQCNNISVSIIMQSNEQKSFSIPCSISGKNYDDAILLFYTDVDSQLVHSIKGRMSGNVEP